MATISETNQRPAIARGDTIPDFTAHTTDGDTIRSRDFYMRRNLAIVFIHEPECLNCRTLLAEIAQHQAGIQAEAGASVAIAPGEEAAVGRLRNELDLPYPLVADANGDIHRQYGIIDADGNPGAAIVIADRYGTVFETSIADPDHTMIQASEVPGWLEFVACRCS